MRVDCKSKIGQEEDKTEEEEVALVKPASISESTYSLVQNMLYVKNKSLLLVSFTSYESENDNLSKIFEFFNWKHEVLNEYFVLSIKEFENTTRAWNNVFYNH